MFMDTVNKMQNIKKILNLMMKIGENKGDF